MAFSGAPCWGEEAEARLPMAVPCSCTDSEARFRRSMRVPGGGGRVRGHGKGT